jgi:CheY-like chemotaxis protein/multidrug efflux pump subunit AcrA (membrane-fusion protein)
MLSPAKPATILVVDDDEVLLQVLSRVLRREGHTVFAVASVAQALESAEQQTPDLALLDLALPDGDGVDLARKLRDRRPRLPMILMTAYPLRLRDQGDFSRFFVRVLTKPADLAELRDAVHTALEEESMDSSVPSPSPDPALAWPAVAEVSATSATPVAGVSATSAAPVLEVSATSAAPPVEGGEPARGRWAWVSSVLGVSIVVLVLAAFLAYVAEVPLLSQMFASTKEEKQPTPEGSALPKVELMRDRPHTLVVPRDVRTALGIRKGDVDVTVLAKPPTESRPLRLPGSTAFDPARVMRVRARFAPARVQKIGEFRYTNPKTGQSEFRELRPGDRIQKGQLLGVFDSEVAGQKKNDLIDALVQLRLDQDILDLGEKAAADGGLSYTLLLTYRRNVEGDHNAVRRAVNTLVTWDIPEEEIQAVRDEAAEILKRGGKRDKDKEKQWARVELRAPDDGIIVERNVALHELLIDQTVNLFQIAKVDRMMVLVNAPEDELETLEALTPDQKRWMVRTIGAPKDGLPGTIDEIGYLIDPNQHTAIIKGYFDNPGQRVRAGQFASATVNIPPPDGVVEIPIDALVDDGKQAVVFVQTDGVKHHYTMRRVEVTERFERTSRSSKQGPVGMVFVRSTPIPREERLTDEEAEEGLLPKEPLRPGERVLLSGAGELKAALQILESQPDKESKEDKP